MTQREASMMVHMKELDTLKLGEFVQVCAYMHVYSYANKTEVTVKVEHFDTHTSGIVAHCPLWI